MYLFFKSKKAFVKLMDNLFIGLCALIEGIGCLIWMGIMATIGWVIVKIIEFINI